MQLAKFKFYFKEYIYRNTSGRKAIAYLIPAYSIYILMLLVTIPKLMGVSNGMKIFDMMPFGYGVDYANELLNALGVEGRKIYLYQQIPLDLFYPFLSGIANCLVLSFFLNKLKSLKEPYIYLCSLPLLASMFDYLENFGVIGMLTNYPDYPQFLIQVNSFFSVAKSLFTTVYFIVLIFSVIIYISTRFANSHRN